jgi:hypothetical protein
MVIPYEFNACDGHLGPVNAAVWSGRTRIVVWSKHQPDASGEIQRELPDAITLQRVRVASRKV